ncbi:APC family permease [Kitasatospora sp. NPDC093550]|uniref:APC family permease n=1 Tax=Kitasatospora sp. NPDC093550 TaxID=3364089 RepID=UPI0038178281
MPSRLSADRSAPAHAEPVTVAKVLGVGDGVAIALSNISPSLSIGVGLGIIGSAIAAPGLPAAFLLAFLPIIGIAVAYARLNEYEPNCGAAYIWVGRVLGPWWGYLIGWVIVASNVILLSYTTSLLGTYGMRALDALGLASAAGASRAAAVTFGVLALGALAWLAAYGVEAAARFQKVLVVVEAATVTLFCGWALVAADTTPFSWTWFSPAVFGSPAALATGVVLSVFLYWGWEAAFLVTEETVDRRTSSRVGFIALLVVLAMFLLASVAFQKATTPQELVEHGGAALPYIGGQLAGTTGKVVASVVLFLCTVSVILAVLIATARQTLAMAREGVLSPVWAKLHPTHLTPAHGTALITAFAAALTVLSLALGPVATVVVGAVTAVGILISGYYALTGIACAVLFARAGRRDLRTLLGSVAVPLLSGLVLAALGVYLAYLNWTSTPSFAFDASNGRFRTLLPVAIILLGLPLGVWRQHIRKAPRLTAG